MKRVMRLTLIFTLALSCTFAFAQTTKRIDIWDYCDPVSFAVLGPDTCQRDTSTGPITFAGFGTGLDQSVGAWRFAPDNLRAKKGVTLTLVMRWSAASIILGGMI